MKLDTISLLMIPGFIGATIVGALSGKIAKYLGSKQCITIAMSCIVVSLLLGAFFVQTSVVVLVISMVLFSGSFAFMYAPLIDSCIRTIEKEKAGTVVGFYNLTLSVAMSIGIAYTAAMMDNSSMQTSFLGITNNSNTSMFSNILFILVLITLLSLSLYWVLVGRKATK
ncbi:MFS family permease [Paenibacillus aceris]|uniref:MFS family permease n=1 Tax=Paenibacillus aceris TaxID=869555 RepID=A0ABS4HUQ0_9BACL|nr:MFS family permease [Paenibacillus aceris]